MQSLYIGRLDLFVQLWLCQQDGIAFYHLVLLHEATHLHTETVVEESFFIFFSQN